MSRLLDTLKALAACFLALALLLVFIVFGRLFGWKAEGERWYE
jgi:hypothetical protein